MFENIVGFFKKMFKKEEEEENNKDMAKERLHLVLMQDRANVSADFLEMMKQEIIDVIKKYIDVDEKEIDVHLTSKTNEDGTTAAPALYANIPIVSIKHTGDMDDEVVEKVQEVEEKKDNRPTDNAERIEEKSTDTAVEPKKEEKLEATNTDSKVEEKPVEEVSINKENGITEEQHKIEEVTKNEEKTTSGTSDNSQDKIVKENVVNEKIENKKITTNTQVKQEPVIHNNRKRRNKKRKGRR